MGSAGRRGGHGVCRAEGRSGVCRAEGRSGVCRMKGGHGLQGADSLHGLESSSSLFSYLYNGVDSKPHSGYPMRDNVRGYASLAVKYCEKYTLKSWKYRLFCNPGLF